MDFLVCDNGKAERWLNGFYGSSFELHQLHVDFLQYPREVRLRVVPIFSG